MAYSQMMRSTEEVKCIDNNAFKPYDTHYGQQHNHSAMACQTTCQGTNTGSHTHFGGVNPHTHQATNGYGQYGGVTQGYNGTIPAPGYNAGATHGYSGGAGQVHGYNTHGATQVHGYGATQVQGFNGASGVAGMPCVGKKHGNGYRRNIKHKRGGMGGGHDSCSSESDSESDDECHRRC